MKTHAMLLTLAFVVGVAASARAQAPTSSDPQTGQGPLIVERIPSGWVVSPDVTITEVNKQAATLVGVYGGWLSDRTWLVGAGGYWLANNAHDFSMAYGGIVTQYLVRSDRALGGGVGALDSAMRHDAAVRRARSRGRCWRASNRPRLGARCDPRATRRRAYQHGSCLFTSVIVTSGDTTRPRMRST